MNRRFDCRAVLVDYDEDLFPPTGTEAGLLAARGIEWVEAQKRTTDEVIGFACDADVVPIQSVRHLLNREVIERLHRCRCIARLGIGDDNVYVTAATE